MATATRFDRVKWNFQVSAEDARAFYVSALLNCIDGQHANNVWMSITRTVEPNARHEESGCDVTYYCPLGLACQVMGKKEKKYFMTWSEAIEIDMSLVRHRVNYCCTQLSPYNRLRGCEAVLLPTIVADWYGFAEISPQLIEPVKLPGSSQEYVSLEHMHRSGLFSYADMAEQIKRGNIRLK